MKITKEQLKQIIKEELESLMQEEKGVFPSLPGSDPSVVKALNTVIEFSGIMAPNFPRVAQDLQNLSVGPNDIQNYYQLFWNLKGDENARLEALLHDLIQFMEGR